MYIYVFNVFIGLYTRCTFMYFTCSVVPVVHILHLISFMTSINEMKISVFSLFMASRQHMYISGFNLLSGSRHQGSVVELVIKLII